MIVLGLDPADVAGWCILEDGKVVDYGNWHLVVSSEEHPGHRLSRLVECLRLVWMKFGFQVIATENASFGSINPNTAAMHNMKLGMITWFASQKGGMRILKYVPSSIKKFVTGSGKAEKSDMIAAVMRHHSLPEMTGDEADAIGIAMMGFDELINGKATKPAKVKRKAAKKKQPKLF
jgi:Holliday junction resolvasome RuvABC endonuclease subunit